MARTAEIFDEFESSPEWGGHGYLGGREHLTDEKRENSDKIALEDADAAALTDAQLFQWANSRAGRHYADAARDWGLIPEEKWTALINTLLPSVMVPVLEAEVEKYFNW